MVDESKAPEERLAAQTEVSDLLTDRLIVADYGKRRQPYVFCGFIPGSSILMKWPHKANKYAPSAVHLAGLQDLCAQLTAHLCRDLCIASHCSPHRCIAR